MRYYCLILRKIWLKTFMIDAAKKKKVAGRSSFAEPPPIPLFSSNNEGRDSIFSVHNCL